MSSSEVLDALAQPREEAVAWFESREDFRKLKEEHQAYLDKVTLRDPFVPGRGEYGRLEDQQASNAQEAFDIGNGVVQFLAEIGALNPSSQDALPGEASGRDKLAEESLISRDDLELLASVLPVQTATALLQSPPRLAEFDDESQLKARILDTMARLALSHPFTIPIARIFKPIFIDLASRWLILLGFTGTGFDTTGIHKSALALVLTALSRTLPAFHQLYPICLLTFHHPYLGEETLANLLEPTDVQAYAGPSSAFAPSAMAPETILHPDLPLLLLTFWTLLVAIPQLPMLQVIRQKYGFPAPPGLINETMSTHPHIAMRTLAWQLSCLWIGWTGPKKEDLRRKYVYDPERDPSNGRGGFPATNDPIAFGESPEEWLPYWSHLPEKPVARMAASGSLLVSLVQPALDGLALERHAYYLALREWTIKRDTPEIVHLQARHLPMSGADPSASPLLADVSGTSLLREVYLPKQRHLDRSRSEEEGLSTSRSLNLGTVTYVPTMNCEAAMKKLAVHVAAREPTLLSAGPSCGKTTVLRELHRKLYSLRTPGSTLDPLVTVNLADRSLDAKSLLGTLTSSPTEPGIFVFVEGSLTRALKQGRWLVLEDIDKASEEVLAIVADLVKSIKLRTSAMIGGGWGGTQHLGVGVQAGNRWTDAAEGFMLFATRSVGRDAAFALGQDNVRTAATFFGAQNWSESWLDTPSIADIRQVLDERFRNLGEATSRILVDTWSAISEIVNSAFGTSSNGLSRQTGLRDLIAWGTRISRSMAETQGICNLVQHPQLQDEAFLDAADIFLNSQTMGTPRSSAIVRALREGLNLNEERVEWLLCDRLPEVSSACAATNGRVMCGRVRLQRRETRRPETNDENKPYALSRPFLHLLEKIAACVQHNEAALLIGETGTGKTTAVEHLAKLVGKNMIALNLSSQTEASDLMGGYRPVNEAEEMAQAALLLVGHFSDVFAMTFEPSRNLEYTKAVERAYKKGRWPKLASLLKEAGRLAFAKIGLAVLPSTEAEGEDMPRKKRKTANTTLASTWQNFLLEVQKFEARATDSGSKVAKFKFAFAEGPLVKAIQSGDWVLLDEVNLATSETLESLTALLQDATSSLVLTERGDLEPVKRHSDFRLFACMNPANDVGKRDLPPALRNKFTEIFVSPPDSDKDVLISLVHSYVGHVSVGDKGVIADIAELYVALKDHATRGLLADGTNHPPHFSMRTLSRALVFASDFSAEFGIRRAVYDGFLMCFTTALDGQSRTKALDLMASLLVNRSKSPRSFFKGARRPPSDASHFVNIGSYWLARGRLPQQEVEEYILTNSVQEKLKNVARSVAAKRFPILLQGPTSSGKTSIIEYLAKRSGHCFVRINNHEHTDIQEYMGSYASDSDTGKLVYKEGLLVSAVRNGHWLVLDELNLAPTDVLEALNRLLDDNRELVLPETQEVIKPHPHFMLFATQNPPGLYGGRKVLSRAFRNRFLEMHFNDVPQDELETILCRRCKIAPTYASKIIAVFLELQRRRQSTRVFEEKHAFVTLRDVFRWGNRSAVGYEQLALDGYMLLAERTRSEEDRTTVQRVLESTMKVTLDPPQAYDTIFYEYCSRQPDMPNALVWTRAMKRLFVLVQAALAFNEPVLLVGETGTGKTSVCHVLAEAANKQLHTVSCHQNTETADLIGSQRPLRNRSTLQESLEQEARILLKHVTGDDGHALDFVGLVDGLASIAGSVQARSLLERMRQSTALFIWYDGPLVSAMKTGSYFLLDEISLADDSVLERLNSVLEPARTLTIAEKGTATLDDATAVASSGFQFIATMNPGGDYGKKELSPALRNRFTEIWVPWVSDPEDILNIVQESLKQPGLHRYAEHMLHFSEWYTRLLRPREAYLFGSVVTLRDLLAWAAFLPAYSGPPDEAFVQGALLTLVDSIGSTAVTSSLSQIEVNRLRESCLQELAQLAVQGSDQESMDVNLVAAKDTDALFLQYQNGLDCSSPCGAPIAHYSLKAPHVRLNCVRVMRALQLHKPVLLEGSPGVGKTSLVVALSNLMGQTLTRINLSDQTDLSDLFGSDIPVENGRPGEFAWRDAPFLAAMQSGKWVLLDEMNLASQAILEGLNSCLDHRGSIYIPELDKTFVKHPNFRIFAAQNPVTQGGSRKGLPRSFVDRFTQVFMDELQSDDYLEILLQQTPEEQAVVVGRMVEFAQRLRICVAEQTRNFRQGIPWEINLRDLLRWLNMIGDVGEQCSQAQALSASLDMLFLQRFRDIEDRTFVQSLSAEIFGHLPDQSFVGCPSLSSTSVRIGPLLLPREDLLYATSRPLPILQAAQLRPLKAISSAMVNKHLVILTGRVGSGKSSLVRTYSCLTGKPIRYFVATPQTDTLEMLGSFEQYSRVQHLVEISQELEDVASLALHSDNSDVTWKVVNKFCKAVSTFRNNIQGADETVQEPSIQIMEKMTETSSSLHVCRHIVQRLKQAVNAQNVATRFEWHNGPLVHAMSAGELFVIQDANRCSSAVLDRLNSLFEPNGILQLNERGLDEKGSIPTFRPHPDFRVVMTVDPQNGELSRAMRNRGVEISLLPWFARVETASVGLRPASLFEPDNPVTVDQCSANSFAPSADSWHAARAVRAVGQQKLSNIAVLGRPYGHENRAEIYKDLLDLPLWSSLQASRTGLAQRDRRRRDHQTIMWSLDGHQSLPGQFSTYYAQQLTLDTAVEASVGTCLSWLSVKALCVATSASSASSTVLQRSYMHNVHPHRSSNVEKGIEYLFALIECLHHAILSSVSADGVLELDLLTFVGIANALTRSSKSEHLDYSIYRALLSSILTHLPALTATTEGMPSRWQQVRQIALKAEEAVRRTTGFQMEALWAAIEAQSRLMGPAAAGNFCDSTCNRIPRDLLSLYIEFVTDKGIDRLQAGLEDDLRKKIESYSSRVPSITKLAPLSASLPAILETQVLSQLWQGQSLPSLEPAAVLQLSGRTLESCRRFANCMSANKAPNLCHTTAWLKQLSTRLDDNNGQTIIGSLLTSCGTGIILEAASELKSESLRGFMARKTSTQAIGEAYFELVSYPGASRLDNLLINGMGMLLEVLRALGHCHGCTLEDPGVAGTQIIACLQTNKAWSRQTSALVEALAALTRHLPDTFNEFAGRLSRYYLCFGSWFWSIYVPDIPLDPANAASAARLVQSTERDDVLAQAVVDITASTLSSAGTRRLQLLNRRMRSIEAKLANQPATTSREIHEGLPGIQALFAELQSCTQHIMSSAILTRLQGPVCEGDLTLKAQVATLQASVLAIIDRLPKVYAHYLDIVQPLCIALGACIIGFELRNQTIVSAGLDKTARRAVSSVIPARKMPHALACHEIHQSDQFHAVVDHDTLQFTIAKLEALVLSTMVAGVPMNNQTFVSVSVIYDQIFGMWSIDRENAEAAAMQADSIYRSRRTDHASAGEDDEVGLALLFPTYETEVGVSSSYETTGSQPNISADDIQAVYKAHIALWSSGSRTDAETPKAALKRTCFSITKHVYETYGSSIPARVDYGHAWHNLDDLAESLQASDHSSTDSYDFYRDANAKEAIRLGPLCDGLGARLRMLLDAWPEQMILSDVLDKLLSITSIPASAPLARFLAAIETLLFKIEDWEPYASRETTLRDSTQAITALVVDWRRLELQSWAGLLDAEERTLRERVDIWWFRLYELCVCAPAALTSTDGAQHHAYLEELVALVTSFLNSSPAGQLSDRLTLLHSFATFTRLHWQSQPSQALWAASKDIANILHHLAASFAENSRGVSKFLTTEHSRIKKELHEIIKLASWRDVNVHALKDSARKSHRQLYKRVRAWRKALETETSTLLAVSAERPASVPAETAVTPLDFRVALSQVLVDLPDMPSSVSETASTLPRTIVQLRPTYRSFQQITSNIRECIAAVRAAAPIEDLRLAVAERSDSLRHATLPALDHKDYERSLRTLTDRKRKAWSALLAEARRIGLSPRPSERTVRRLSRTSQLLCTGNLLPHQSACLPESLLQTVDGSFYHLVGLLPQLQQAPAQHHPDIQPQQIQAAVGSVFTTTKLLLDNKADIYTSCLLMRKTFLLFSKLQALDKDEVAPFPTSARSTTLPTFRGLFATLTDVLREAIRCGDGHMRFARPSRVKTHALVKAELQKLQERCSDLSKEMENLEVNEPLTGLLSRKAALTLDKCQKLWQQALQQMSELVVTTPSFRYLLSPVQAWMENQQVLSEQSSKIKGEPELRSFAIQAHVECVSVMLVSMQDLAKSMSTSRQTTESDGALVDNGTKLQMQNWQTMQVIRHLESIVERMQAFINAITEVALNLGDTTLVQTLIARTLPFLACYVQLMQTHIVDQLQWQIKLTSFACLFSKIALMLAKDGFCRPETASKTSSGQPQTLDGTGVGQGEGAENVSNQVTEDSQVEGLENDKDETGEESKSGEKDNEDAMHDMDDDFGGRTEDVAEQSEANSDNEDSRSEDQNDLDEELGDVDPLEPSAIDDKFWDDKRKEDEENESPNEHTEAQAGADGKPETGNKDDSEAKGGDEDKPATDPDVPDPASAEPLPDTSQQLPQSGEPEEEPDNIDEEDRHELPDIDMTEQTLDLPEDLDLDIDAPRSPDVDDVIDDELEADEPSPSLEPNTEEAADLSSIEDPVPETEGAMSEEKDDQDPENEGAELANEMEDKVNRDVHDGSSANQHGESMGNESGEPRDLAKTSSPEAARASTPMDGVEAPNSHERSEPTDVPSQMQQQGAVGATQPSDPADTGDGQEPMADGSDHTEQRHQLGDNTKAFMRRLQAIPDAEDSEVRPPDSGLDQAGKEADLEFDLEAPDTDGLQAVGSATEEEAMQASARVGEAEMLDTFLDMEIGDQPEHVQVPNSLEIPDALDESMKVESEQTVTSNTGHEMQDQSAEDGSMAELDRLPDTQDEAGAAEAQLSYWFSGERQNLSAPEVWRLYTSLTRELSFSLTEALRLILEPTLATRLQGDYRSGKRLNMRKIIPYIASDFTKDKIWMRRTRPSQRDYQILLAVDDSRSMADSSATHLAFQTLALVSQALTRLEVGEISVCRFGEDVEFVHRFGNGLISESVGASIIDHFGFAQRSTDVRKLLQRSLTELSEAKSKSKSSGNDIWQLEIIVSDGICQDLDDIHSLIRKANEQKVMVVFLVLDSLNKSHTAKDGKQQIDSILSMQSVSYTKGKTGSLELKMERYMDRFPFEYYIILQDVQSLPEVLGETLRQFFERIGGS